jgi:hypothetical protein
MNGFKKMLMSNTDTTGPNQKIPTYIPEYSMNLPKCNQVKEYRIDSGDIETYEDYRDWYENVKENGDVIFMIYCCDGVLAIVLEK